MSIQQNEAISSFWGAVIPPNKSILLDFPSETNLIITNMSFDQIVSEDPSKITATIITLQILDDESVVGDECASHKSDELFVGTLVPNRTEQIPVNLQFSPLDAIEMHNSGPNEVHLSGFLVPIDDDYFEEEEEEEEEFEADNELQPTEVQNRFAEMAKNQPPKPAYVKKPKKKKNKHEEYEVIDQNENENEQEEEKNT